MVRNVRRTIGDYDDTRGCTKTLTTRNEELVGLEPGYRLGSASGGFLLRVAHVAWVAVVLVDAAAFVPGAAFYDRSLHTPCPSQTISASDCAPGQLSPAAMLQLSHLGFSLDLYAALLASFTILVSILFFVIAAFIAKRKWNEGIGLLSSVLLITLGASGGGEVFSSVAAQVPSSFGPVVDSIVQLAGAPIFVLQWPALGAFLLTFPTGRCTPRWTWSLVGLWITNFLAFFLGPPLWVTFLSVAVTFGSVVVVQVYRYRRAYGTVERQQTKWVLYLLAISVVVDIGMDGLVAASAGAAPDSTSTLLVAVFNAITGTVVFLLIVLGIAIAVLRYRLYDIDILINRTLVYGSATISLGALYVGGVIALQSLTQFVTGQSSDVAIAVATLVIAALFTPWRRRLQTFIDQRFYRRKYDASLVVAAFGATLPQQVDLDELTGHLVGVVQDTMQPQFATLWLPAGGGGH